MALRELPTVPTLTPLVARQDLLDTLISEAAAGQGALLLGVAGIGKSRILAELVRIIRSSGGRSAALVVATAPVTGAPLGAFRSLVTGSPDIGTARAELLARGLTLLAVDDAHLLDPLSAGLLYDLALAGVPLVVSVRRDEPLPPAVREIWKCGLVTPHEVEALTLEQSAELARHILQAQVDTGLGWALHTRAAGNPLMLRELIAAGLRTRTIEQRRHLWSLVGRIPESEYLSEVMDLRIRDLPPAVRTLAEIVALAEPLSISLAQAIHGETS